MSVDEEPIVDRGGDADQALPEGHLSAASPHVQVPPHLLKLRDHRNPEAWARSWRVARAEAGRAVSSLEPRGARSGAVITRAVV